MIRTLLTVAAAGTAMASATPAMAQATIAQSIAGTRVDVAATGSVDRVPDVAIVSAGVVTRAATASAAVQQNAARMARVRAALTRAGIADRDIQTTSINLNPDYSYENNQPPRLTGYNATNQVTVRFRDIANTGKILDALVAEGANSINGPTLTIDKPDEAMDEARAQALQTARARADLYARLLGKRVVRVVALSESGGPVPIAMPMMAMRAQAADTKIDPGEQKVEVTLNVTYELQ